MLFRSGLSTALMVTGPAGLDRLLALDPSAGAVMVNKAGEVRLGGSGTADVVLVAT